MKKLKLSRIIIQWVKHFMTERSSNLIFDENKSKTYYVESGIPQGSPISPILFLIYIGHLFPKIRMKFNAHSPSFIDDVAIYVEIKLQNRIAKIEIIVKTAFDWAASNNVKFDDDKSELIHFEKTRKVSKDTLELPNGTVIEPKNVVKWLGVWLDRKLNFKKHVETQIDLFCELIVFRNSEFDEIRMGSETDHMQTALFFMRYSYFGLRLRNLE